MNADVEKALQRLTYFEPCDYATFKVIRQTLIDQEAEIARLRGLRPELPPRSPAGSGLPRYGLRWISPDAPVVVPMGDGYWTPWHLAEKAEALLRDIKAWDVGSFENRETIFALPLALRQRITAHLSENSRDA